MRFRFPWIMGWDAVTAVLLAKTDLIFTNAIVQPFNILYAFKRTILYIFAFHFILLMKVRIVNKSKNELPAYETPASAGMDLRANLNDPIVLKPLGRSLIPTGLFIEIPQGYEAQIRPRSGLAIKKGITLLNSPGTIDADYRGEIKVIVANISDTEFVVEHGERIAQMVIAKHEHAEWVEVNVLNETSRGSGGFGSTGTK